MRVGIDLDGVCFDFAASLLRYALHKGYEFPEGFHAHGEPKEWAFYEGWGLSLEDFLQMCHDGADAGFVFSGPVRPGVKEAFDIIIGLGHEIIIITDRAFGTTPEVSQQLTVEWLDFHELNYDELHFSGDKTVVPTDYFIEDKLSNYDALVAAGVDTFLVDRPWNQTDLPDARRRVDGIREYARILTLIGQEELVYPLFEIVGGTGEVRSVSSTGGEKGVKIGRFDLIPADAEHNLAVLYGAGAKKYDDNNWMRGYEWSKSIAAARRHINLHMRGEDLDAEMTELAGQPVYHLTCAAWHCFAVVHFMLNQDSNEAFKLFDDRVSKRGAAE
jgi:hypothetical protein